MTKRQLSATEEGELNTPEFDDDIDDRPINVLPLTICPIRRQPFPFSSPLKDTKLDVLPISSTHECEEEGTESPLKEVNSLPAAEVETPGSLEAVGQESDDEALSESKIYDMIEGKIDGNTQPESGASTSTGPPAKRRQFAIVGDKLISGPDFNVTKYVMEEFPDPSVLPSDWVKINHESGIPVYFHKRTRVATLSKPFCVGKYPARLRHIPLSAIPCLKQQRDLTAVKAAAEKKEAVNFDHRNLQHGEVREYCGKLFKINQLSIGRWTNWKNRRQFEKLLHRVNNDADNPELSNVKIIGGTTFSKKIPQSEGPAPSIPELPTTNRQDEEEEEKEDVEEGEEGEVDADEGVVQEVGNGEVADENDKLADSNPETAESGLILRGAATYIRVPQVASKPGDQKGLNNSSAGASVPVKGRKQYLRVDGKPANAVLNEFTVLSTGDYPQYEDVQLPSCERSGEFCCVVKIGGIIYGIGRGRNKKLAKLEAAQEALRALIPGWRTSNPQNKPGVANNNNPATGSGGGNEKTDNERDPMLQSVSVFDTVPVDNPNITDMCQQLGLPTPYKILQTCLLRNFGIGDTELTCTVEQLSAEESNRPGANKSGQHQHHQYRLDKIVRLSVGERSAEVRAVSSKQGKHLAAQALLKQMHPHIGNWASLLRLYLRGPDVNLTATAALQRDTAVHEMAVQKRSSSEILIKLREEMRKLAAELEQKKREKGSGSDSQHIPGDLFSLSSVNHTSN